MLEFDYMIQADLRWYAVYTKARHEKTAAELLWQKDIESFLPLREVLSRWKDRRKMVQFPLFPGYLFIQSLKHFVFAEIPLNPYPYLKEGDEVRIIRGALKGLRGVLVEKKSQFRFVLSVDLIQQSVSCEIDAEDCEKV
jgi:transcription antitermination factor NusG